MCHHITPQAGENGVKKRGKMAGKGEKTKDGKGKGGGAARPADPGASGQRGRLCPGGKAGNRMRADRLADQRKIGGCGLQDSRRLNWQEDGTCCQGICQTHIRESARQL